MNCGLDSPELEVCFPKGEDWEAFVSSLVGHRKPVDGGGGEAPEEVAVVAIAGADPKLGSGALAKENAPAITASLSKSNVSLQIGACLPPLSPLSWEVSFYCSKVCN